MLLEYLTKAEVDRTAIASLADYEARADRAVVDAGAEASIDRAVAAGFAGDRVGYAFVGGYRAALARLVPGVSPRACLCATEPGGAHPRNIKTTLARAPGENAWILHGTKTWVTLGSAAEELVVVASIGEDAGKNRLRVARVRADRAGVSMRERGAAPFAPEVPHAEVTFDGVRVEASEVLAGDGYDAYLKPFRTIEDVHVFGALLGYLVFVARASSWQEGWIEEALASIVLFRAIGAEDPSSAETHLALAGALRGARRLIAECDPFWSTNADGEARLRWTRDKPLFEVAESARRMRREAAWRSRGAR